MSSRVACGSAPKIRTTRLVATLSNHTTGRTTVANRSSGRATTSPHRSARCMATRLGANSPSTNVTKVNMAVTSTTATGRAAPPRKASGPTSGWASETAAAADARNPASVMPIWVVARNRFGSRASRASVRPLRDPRARPRIWPSRSDTNAISLPAKAALIRTSSSTSASSVACPPTSPVAPNPPLRPPNRSRPARRGGLPTPGSERSTGPAPEPAGAKGRGVPDKWVGTVTR